MSRADRVDQRGVLGRLGLLYPLLFLVVPALGIAARNPGQFALSDLALILGVLLAAGALVYFLIAMLFGRRSPERAAIIASAVLGLFFYLMPVSGVLSHVSWKLSRPLVLIGVGGAVLSLALWRMKNAPERTRALSRLLGVVAAILVVWNGGLLLVHVARGRHEIVNSAFVRQTELKIPVTGPRGGISHDIYLVVFDEYASSDMLREHFGLDNRPFEDSLRHRGFVILRDLRSNYATTMLSLPSLLNFTQLTQLADELGPTSTDRTVLRYMVANNRTARVLAEQGYRRILFPSAWYTPTLSSQFVDEEFRAWKGVSLKHELERTELRRALRASSLFALGKKLWGSSDSEHILRSFQGLARIADRAGPTFTFAHVMAPHRPYTLDADCGPVDRSDLSAVPTDAPASRAAYVEQLRCLNSLILELVDSLQHRAGPAPIILLLSDHGTDVMQPFSAKDTLPAAAALRERFSPFGAYYLPGSGEMEFETPVTLVDVMPRVLRHYFGAEIPPAPNDMYFSSEGRPFDFHLVPPTLIRSALDSGAVDRGGQRGSVSEGG